MATALFSHIDCLSHVTPGGHPEQVARLEFISQALSGPEFDQLLRHDAPLCQKADITLGHSADYLARIAGAPVGHLDGDTFMSEGSYVAAQRAVGGTLAAVDMVLSGKANNAFVACRPPGHHAETAKPMGFCLFGNAALAVKHALERHGLARVAVVDFDVHHGNGTQDLLWNEERALFISSHQMPLWPGSGASDETGINNNIMNLPLSPGSDGSDMRSLYEGKVFPTIEAFDPDLILISAGFDAHMSDPLANLNWSTEDFTWLTGRLCDLAQQHCQGRVVSTLEGGYDLRALAASVAAHVSVLMERAT